ncbi:MAG: tetratricopeptide repeat protein [Pyrinomonadaceae bacterium]
MPKICPHCGTETVADARFCRACGLGLNDQIFRDMPTGPTIPGATSAFSQKPVDTGNLDQNLPGTVSFDTVVDRPSYNTVIDRNAYAAPSDPTPSPPPAAVEQPAAFDPKATHIDAKSTSYFNPGDAAPTSALTPQQTMNLASAMNTTNRPAAPVDAPPETAKPIRPTTEFKLNRADGGSTSAGERFEEPPPPPPPPRAIPSAPPPLSSRPPPAPTRFSTPASGGVGAAGEVGAIGGAPPRPTAGGRGIRAWHVIVGAGVLVLVIGGLLVGALIVARNLNASTTMQNLPPPAPTMAPAPEAAPAKSAAEMLVEAEALHASGDAEGALALVRSAVQMEPSNPDAQRRLGDLLVKTGARREAILAYRAAVAIDSANASAWQALAAAEFDEGFYADSANSYRQLIALGAGPPSEDVQLALGDALRAAGQLDEAKVSYEKLALSSSPVIAGAARQRLTELAKLQVSGLPPAPEATRAARNRNDQMLASTPVAPVPTVVAISPPTPVPPAPRQPRPEPPKLTAADHYQRGVELWGSNRGAAVGEFLQAQGVPDANYYLGLNIAEGRDPKNLGPRNPSRRSTISGGAKGSHGAQVDATLIS